MELRKIKVDKSDIDKVIRSCYEKDSSVYVYSQYKNESFDDIIKHERSVIGEDLNFYKLYDEDKFIGYFGIEDKPISTLTTFYISPEYRDRKNAIWKYMTSHLPKTFYAALYDVNTRAKRFFDNQGAKVIKTGLIDNKPSTIYMFEED